MTRVHVRIAPEVVVTFENATHEITAAQTLIVRNSDGVEAAMYPQGTYVEVTTSDDAG